MSNNIFIELGLVEISELKELLGYKDIRAVRSWCNKNDVTIQVLGKKNYINKRELFNLLDLRYNEETATKSKVKSESVFADQNQRLAGKNSHDQSNSHFFTNKNSSNSCLESLVSKYKSKLND